MTNFIAKINTYYNEKGIQEKEIISGQLPLKVQVDFKGKEYPAEVVAVDEEAEKVLVKFKDSTGKLKKIIKNIQQWSTFK